jgi:hypothetical protein
MDTVSRCIRVVAVCSLLCGALSMTSCASRPQQTEAEWNQLHIWQRVGDTPPTYVPKGYGVKQPRTPQEGTLIVDRRDGKRFFVPKGGVPGYSAGVLVGEAKKVTGYKHPSPRSPAENALVYPVCLLLSLGSGGAMVLPDD